MYQAQTLSSAPLIWTIKWPSKNVCADCFGIKSWQWQWEGFALFQNAKLAFTYFRYFSNYVHSSDTFKRKHFKASVNADITFILRRGMKHLIYIQDETGGKNSALRCLNIIYTLYQQCITGVDIM